MNPLYIALITTVFTSSLTKEINKSYNHWKESQKSFILININTASFDELITLSGIGPKKAEAIIKYREKRRFKNIKEITKVKGIGKKTFDKLKSFITVDQNPPSKDHLK